MNNMKTQQQINRSNFFARIAIKARKKEDDIHYLGKWKRLPDGTCIRSHYA